MKIFTQNTDGLNEALEKMKTVPDAKFSNILNDELKMTAIKEQFLQLNSNRNVGDGKASTTYFKYADDRDLLDRIIVYYKARIDWLQNDSKHFGHTKNNIVACFDSVDWINAICQDAGIRFEVKPATIKTEQEKRAEQDSAGTAVAEHTSGKRKSVKSQPVPEVVLENPTQDSDVVPNEPVIGTPFLANGMQFVLYSMDEAYQMPERSAIIDDYFYADTINLLYGQAGSFKTWYALWEGVSLAIGNELCGMPINDGEHRVLYISLEMTAKGLADRLSGMVRDMDIADREKVNCNLKIISAENTNGMKATDEFLSALSVICADNNFDVIYIDSFADFIAGHDIRSEGEMTAILDKLRTFVLNNHVSFRIIHHGTKPTQDSNGSMAGIHTIRDLVDYVFLIKASGENEIKITDDMQVDNSAKSRYSAPVKKTLKFICDDGSYSFKVIEETETVSYIGLFSKVLTEIENNPGISSGELREILNNPKNLTTVLKNAVRDEKITEKEEKSSRGSKKKCYYPIEQTSEND